MHLNNSNTFNVFPDYKFFIVFAENIISCAQMSSGIFYYTGGTIFRFKKRD